MKKFSFNNPANQYVRRVETLLLTEYRKIIEKNDPETAVLLAKKYEIQDSKSETRDSRNRKNHRMRHYLSFWDSLDDNQRLKVASHDAKFNHLARIVRTIGTTEVVQAHNKIKATTAGSFDFVLQKFRHEGVTAAQLQNFIDENAVAWFSLTGHPTNPTTVAYTKAQIDLARVIADENAEYTDLVQALQNIYDVPIVGERKTPLQEAEEILATLDVLFDTAIPHKEFFEKSLNRYGYAQEGVIIKNPLIVPCAWTLGDGDGNENLTAQVLEDGIKLHRLTIADRYKKFLNRIEDPALTRQVDDFIQRLNSFKSREDLLEAAKKLSDAANDPVSHRLIDDFIYLVKCFGLGFATIDVRHNAVEILEAACRVGALGGAGDFAKLKELDLDTLEKELGRWLEDDDFLSRLGSVAIQEIEQAGDDASARIIGRLGVIGRNPDMCEKLIIAETTHPAHALAALILLKITGNIIGEKGSSIDLTILSESVKDLMALGNTLESLLENRLFREHVVSRQHLLVMIAKSDTTRQDGRGEAEFIQYETAVDIYRVAAKMARKYPELENVKVSIKNGGGHALQRGGGRVTEIAALHGRAAADARVTDCGPSTLTIQGEQLSILFCPGKVALGSLEAFVSQNLYTKAGVRGEMPMPHYPKTINKQYAEEDAWLYAKTAGDAFDKFTKKSAAIDDLLVHAPWLAMKAGNVSSRPAKRGEKAVEPGITPAEAKGEAPKALQGRAISGERLTAHACLPVFSVLGLMEAMEAVREKSRSRENPDKYGEALHHLYRAHKIHRDGARVTINAIPMADFDIAWPLLTGRIRPNAKELDVLATEFRETGTVKPEATLAFLELYFLEVEKLSFEMVSGQHAASTFRAGDALKKLWPEVADEVEHRNRAAEFARVIECHRTRLFDRHDVDALDELNFRITQALYAAANVVNAPVGILATRTKLEPVYEFSQGKKTRFMKPESFDEKQVKDMLHIPHVLAGLV